MKPWDFLKQFCTGTWPGQENTSNIETKSNDNRKATKRELDRYEVTKENIADRIFFLGKVTNGRRDGEWGFRREGRGESNLICLSAGESQPFKLTTSHRFSPNLYHHLGTHPVRLRFFLSF